MTDTVHEYAAEVDLWDRRIRKLIATIIMCPNLTDNERGVMLMLLAGNTVPEIADDYGVHRQRIQSIRRNAWKKISHSMYGFERKIDWLSIYR